MSGVFPEPLVVHSHDDGEHLLVSFTAGPSGVAELRAGDGVWVSVDFADPATLASVRVEVGADPVVLGELIGDERAAAVVRMTPTANGRPRRLPGDRTVSRRQIGRLSSRDPDAEPNAFSSAAVTASLADDPARSGLARAAAHFELIEALSELPGAPLEELISRSVEQAVELLDDCGLEIEVLAEADVGTAKRLAALCHSARRSDPVVADAVERLLSDARTEMVASGQPLLSSPGTVPDFDQPSMVVDLRPSGRLVARCSDGSGQWVRVVHARSLVLMAIAPMRADGGSWRADALVPPDVSLRELRVDLTTEPLPVGGSSLQRMKHAVGLGRRAVEAHVVGRDDWSRQRWAECSQAWRELGDDTRAAVAARYANGAYDLRRNPTVSERVEAVLRPI